MARQHVILGIVLGVDDTAVSLIFDIVELASYFSHSVMTTYSLCLSVC